MKMPLRFAFLTGALATACLLPVAVHAQDEAIDIENTVFSGDYLSVGAGLALGPSYKGSDDYVVFPAPIIQGSLGGIDINARSGGFSLDFLPDADNGPGFDLGLAARMRGDRASQISDDVVKSLGKLDRAIEVGPSVGISFPGVLHGYDSLTFSADALWDVNGAHSGMAVTPSVSYFTPLNQGVIATLSLSAEYADGDFHDYYYRVTPAQSLATAGELPAFEPRGGGFTSAGATLLLGFDLDGDVTNGGLGLVTIVGYSRVLGDAADTPFTSVRGSRDQLFGALGIGYTF